MPSPIFILPFFKIPLSTDVFLALYDHTCGPNLLLCISTVHCICMYFSGHCIFYYHFFIRLICICTCSAIVIAFIKGYLTWLIYYSYYFNVAWVILFCPQCFWHLFTYLDITKVTGLLVNTTPAISKGFLREPLLTEVNSNSNKHRVITCLENLEMSGNLLAVREMSRNLAKVRKMSENCQRKKSCPGKCVLECEECRQQNFAFYHISSLCCGGWQCF